MRIVKFFLKTTLLGLIIGITISFFWGENKYLPTILISIIYTISLWGAQEFYHKKTANFILSRFSLPIAVTIQTLATIFIFLLSFLALTNILNFLLKVKLLFKDYIPTMLLSFFITAVVTSAGYTVFFYKRLSETEKMLREAELKNLKLILNPHFFFNLLNTFFSFIEREPKKAEELLSRMRELFKYSFTAVDKKFFPIKEELNFAKNYLEIQKIRFGERISYSIEEDEIEGNIPPFLIQTLLENAVKYSSGERFNIDLKIKKDGNNLKIEVQNPSSGIIKFIEGHSLYILREKIKRLYRDSHILTDKKGGIVKISVSIPLEND